MRKHEIDREHFENLLTIGCEALAALAAGLDGNTAAEKCDDFTQSTVEGAYGPTQLIGALLGRIACGPDPEQDIGAAYASAVRSASWGLAYLARGSAHQRAAAIPSLLDPALNGLGLALYLACQTRSNSIKVRRTAAEIIDRRPWLIELFDLVAERPALAQSILADLEDSALEGELHDELAAALGLDERSKRRRPDPSIVVAVSIGKGA